MKYKNITYKIRTLTLTLLIMFVGSVFIVSADHYVDFSVKPNLPDNQYNANADYFDLLLEPNQKQTISLIVSNRGSEDMVATIELLDGITGDNGAKLYLKDASIDESQKFALSTISNLKIDTLIVPSNTEGLITLDINMPNESIDGVILGGIRVYADTKEASNNDAPKTGVNINNRIDYTVAVQLRNNGTRVQPNLNLKSVGAKLADYVPKVYANIQNDKPVLMNDVTISGTITDSKNKQVGNVDVAGASIMPNTNFDVAYYMNRNKLDPGEYKLQLKITHEESVWKWEETVTIEKNVAEDINNNVIFDKESTPWLLIFSFSILIMIIFILVWMLYKRRKENKE